MSKRIPKKDPNAQREATKYDNPIPSREFIMKVLDAKGEPMDREAIGRALEIHGPEQKEALRRRLRAMERDGQLLYNRRGGYCLVSKLDLVRGRVIGHPDGFGFLVPEDKGDDLFLSAREMRSLFHGDRIVASIMGIDRRGRREGALVEVLERAIHQVVGRYFEENGIGFVTPDNKRITQDILVPKEYKAGAENGQIVNLEILDYPTGFRQGVGKVVEILGDHMAPGMEIDIAIRSYDIPEKWPHGVEDEIAGLSEEVPEAAKAGREDIRQLPLVTIDGEDSRDFDDAVYVQKDGKGWKLYVAIADVSSYVAPGTALDLAAHERGNSVYFPERVVPMLPEILSNGLCSINPNVDRLCMVCELSLDHEGKTRDYRFFEGLMRSHARLTYTKVAAMVVEQDHALRNEYRDVVPHLDEAYRLYKTLRELRNKRGAIDFEMTETRIVFGSERKIDQIVPVTRNDAHMLIEEFMIAANVASAEFLLKNKVPCLYRVHAQPSMEKLEGLREFLAELGLQLRGGDSPTPKDFSQLLQKVQGRPDSHLISTVMLRSLKQAVYTPDNDGHFGLGFEAYTHFTSPIRRYPDLLVHRAIRHIISKQKVKQETPLVKRALNTLINRKHPDVVAYDYDMQDMLALGEHCSMTERRADEATRDAVDWLKCEYMLDKVGQDYEGIVTSVTNFGLFIELKEIYVEGLVHVTALQNDYYHFDPKAHRLVGERTRKIYRLGDTVDVTVVRVDLEERKIDFQLVGVSNQPGEGGEAAAPKKKRSGKKRSRGRGPKKEAGEAGSQKPVEAGAEGAAPKKRRRRRKKS